jgi:predicted phage tail protein
MATLVTLRMPKKAVDKILADPEGFRSRMAGLGFEVGEIAAKSSTTQEVNEEAKPSSGATKMRHPGSRL